MFFEFLYWTVGRLIKWIFRCLLYTSPYSDLWNLLFGFLLDTAGLSIGLGVFNLVPIPPLDGSKVLAAFLPDHAYFQLMRYERYGMLLLIFISFRGVGGGVISAVINWVWNLFVNLIY